MKTDIEEKDGKFIATLNGEMDTAAALEAEEVLKPLYKTDGKDVIVDCTKLEYIASTGGSRVVMKGVNEDIQTVFKMTGFISLFDFE